MPTKEMSVRELGKGLIFPFCFTLVRDIIATPANRYDGSLDEPEVPMPMLVEDKNV